MILFKEVGKRFMKKIFILITLFLATNLCFANDEQKLEETASIQSRMNNIGMKILNANRLNKRVVFVYDEKSKNKNLKSDKTITKRQVIMYESLYKFIETEDELAAYVSREIPAAIRSYQGLGNGILGTAKLKVAPKKYELVFDKLAVDYMVKAGYNPLGLITFINKTCPQARQDVFSNKNLTSKRLALIYERIYMNYPYFLKNNDYLENESYQNFLLTSQKNRKLLESKIKTGNLDWEVNYE